MSKTAKTNITCIQSSEDYNGQFKIQWTRETEKYNKIKWVQLFGGEGGGGCCYRQQGCIIDVFVNVHFHI